ncbi:MAG: cobalamin-binding protein [Proteobacteria bacterium]|nr:cobalamin-binding protein [Pseudomonadota bacterium]
MRIVSLIASATEIVTALGFSESLVGRSHECDFPASVSTLPVCTSPRFEIGGASADIDRSVKALLRDALSVYQVDADMLAALRPDVIVTQSQCEVCAVSTKDVENALCSWVDSRPRIVSCQPDSLDDVWADIRRVAEALGAPERGTELVDALRARMDSVSARALACGTRPRVACIEWVDPLMASGNWMPTLVEMAGGVNLFGEAGKHAPWMTWDDLVRSDPDVIVALPCGFDIARTRVDMPLLTERAEWTSLRAVRDGRVYVTDGNQYFNRPGPRLAESLEILCELLHPDAFDFGHCGRAWEPLG